MSEIPRRVRAKEAYIRLISAGTQISPKEFARRSPGLIGEQVAYETIRFWYREDGWPGSVLLTEFGDSTELVRTRSFMTSAVAVIMNKEDQYTSQDLASAASEYRKMIGKLPEAFWFVVEEEVIQVRDRLFETCETLKVKKVSYRTITRISGVWADLAKFVVGDVETVVDER